MNLTLIKTILGLHVVVIVPAWRNLSFAASSHQCTGWRQPVACDALVGTCLPPQGWHIIETRCTLLCWHCGTYTLPHCQTLLIPWHIVACCNTLVHRGMLSTHLHIVASCQHPATSWQAVNTLAHRGMLSIQLHIVACCQHPGTSWHGVNTSARRGMLSTIATHCGMLSTISTHRGMLSTLWHIAASVWYTVASHDSTPV